jgi:hypothetical protein
MRQIIQQGVPLPFVCFRLYLSKGHRTAMRGRWILSRRINPATCGSASQRILCEQICPDMPDSNVG